MNKEIHDKIVKLIPSESLKKAIKETGFQFSELDLFRIITRCSPSLDVCIDTLNEAKSEFSPQLAKYTEEYIEYQKGALELFMKHEANYVYMVEVLPQERYIFGTAEEAIEFTALYPKTEYATPIRRFFIEKTPVLRLSRVNDDVLTAGTHNCTATDGHVVEVSSAYDCDYKFPKKCDGRCLDCEIFCHFKDEDEMAFPKFFENGDLIKFPDDRDGYEYAISLGADADCGWTAYCVPLDSAEVVYHVFEDSFYAHQHPDLFEVEKADVSELDEKMREDYLAFRKYLELSTDV